MKAIALRPTYLTTASPPGLAGSIPPAHSSLSEGYDEGDSVELISYYPVNSGYVQLFLSKAAQPFSMAWGKREDWIFIHRKQMPTITAKVSTKLKRQPVDSSRSNPEDWADWNKGQSLAVVAITREGSKHFRATFSGHLTLKSKQWDSSQQWRDAVIFEEHWAGLDQFRSAAIRQQTFHSAHGSDIIDVGAIYQSQMDNNDETHHGPNWRQCMLTSVSAGLRHLWGEDRVQGIVRDSGVTEFESWYGQRLADFGDTTVPAAHIACLKALGVEAEFRRDGNLGLITKNICNGKTVPVGVAWKSDGHWMLAGGVNLSSDGIYMLDPCGKRILGRGGLADGIDKYEVIGWGNAEKAAGDRNLYSPLDLERCFTDLGPNQGWWIDFKAQPLNQKKAPIVFHSPVVAAPTVEMSERQIQPGNFRLNSLAAEFIHSWEGLELEAYLCSSRVPSIGWGTTVYPNGEAVQLGDRCTADQADGYFANDMRYFVDGLNQAVTRPLTPGQVAACLSFIYNCGLGADRSNPNPSGFLGSTLRQVINRGGTDAEVFAQFRRWVNDANGENIGLKKRREGEIALWAGLNWRAHR